MVCKRESLWRLTLNAKRGNGNLFFTAHRFVGLIGQVFFDNKVVDNKLLALHRIFTHIIFEQSAYLVAFVQRHLLQTDLGADKMLKLIGRNLTQTFETSNLRIRA